MADLGKILLMPKGEYDNLTTYELLDIVVYQRNTYVCKVASSLGVLPTNTTNWQIMSEHGADAFGYGYIRYSEYADGTDFVDIPTANTDYIGFYMGNSVTPPVDKTAYTWSKFVGHDGAAGVGISSIIKTGSAGLVDTYTITYTNGTTSTFDVVNGTGNAIYYDISMINTSNVAQTYPTSGIANAVVNDMNVNPTSWNVYKCTVGGSPSVAEWLYIGNIKGASGTGSGDMQSADFVGSSATRSVHAADTLNTTLGNVDQLNSSDFQVVSSVLEIKDSVKDIDAFGATTTLADSNTVAVSLGTNSNRKITWANIKAVLKSYFDTIYSTFSGSYNDLTNKPNLKTVATSGSYNDLSNKPTIPTVDQTYNVTSSNAQSGKAVAQAVGSVPRTLADLSDTTITSPTDGQILEYDGANNVWKNGDNIQAFARYGGSLTFSQLTSALLVAANEDKFFLVTDGGTIASADAANWILPSGSVIPADSHIAVVNVGTSASPSYKFDDFGGYVDISGKADRTELDGWTATRQVQSDGTVTFSGLNDSYGYSRPYYDLPSGDSAYTYSKVTKSGSGTSVTLTYTTDAPIGTVCKLRILK